MALSVTLCFYMQHLALFYIAAAMIFVTLHTVTAGCDLTQWMLVCRHQHLKRKCCFHPQGIRVSYPVDGGSRFLRKAGTLKTTYFNHIMQCQENVTNSITVTVTALNSSFYMYQHL
jgi:hypothetical protein